MMNNNNSILILTPFSHLLEGTGLRINELGHQDSFLIISDEKFFSGNKTVIWECWSCLRQVTWEGFSQKVITELNPEWSESFASFTPQEGESLQQWCNSLRQEYIPGDLGPERRPVELEYGEGRGMVRLGTDQDKSVLNRALETLVGMWILS